jgi:hypothetical protein
MGMLACVWLTISGSGTDSEFDSFDRPDRSADFDSHRRIETLLSDVPELVPVLDPASFDFHNLVIHAKTVR